MSVNPPPVNNPIINPFDLPLTPATSPPINSVKNAMTIDIDKTVISLIDEKRIISANKAVVIIKESNIVTHPYRTARKKDVSKILLLFHIELLAYFFKA